MPRQEIRMPLGLNKIMNSLVKQLEKEMGSMNNNMPSGFKIQISTGERPEKVQQEKPAKVRMLDSKETEKIRALPRKEADSNVRRLSDRIVYEVSVPGVKSKENVVISKLENGIEVKAYSKDMCYVKTIPLNSDIIGYKIKDGILFLELNS
jgi:HSP20 family molecular chaperone IbpA